MLEEERDRAAEQLVRLLELANNEAQVAAQHGSTQVALDPRTKTLQDLTTLVEVTLQGPPVPGGMARANWMNGRIARELEARAELHRRDAARLLQRVGDLDASLARHRGRPR